MSKKYSIEDVFNILGEESLKISKLGKKPMSIKVDGYDVYNKSMRYATFYQKGVKCCRCGKEGRYFQLDGGNEKDHPVNRRHFNLYADDGTLITRDHIFPKSLGGKDTIDNLQTMCGTCNGAKGSNFELAVDGEFVKIHNNKLIFKTNFNIKTAECDEITISLSRENIKELKMQLEHYI